MLKSLFSPHKGQTIILFAVMITALMGFLALAVDIGFTYSSRRFAQNQVDSAALAGARTLAGAVIETTGGGDFGTGDGTSGWAFSVKDSDVRDVVIKYVDDNKGVQPSGAAYALPIIEYLGTDGTTVLGTSPTAGDLVPPNTAMVRVTREMTFNTVFAHEIGIDQSGAGARATARISPTTKPKYPPGPTWPMTRYDDEAATTAPTSGCPDPILFWSGNPSGDTGTTADWKQLMYFGKKSAFVNDSKTGILADHDQLITTFDPEYDPFRDNPPADLKGQDVQTALEYWFLNGFKGQLNAGGYVLPPNDGNLEPGNWIRETHGDKLEVVAGNLGSNMSTNMRAFIQNNVVGYDKCGDPAEVTPMPYTIVYMYLWGPTTKERWRANQTPPYFINTTGSQIERVTLTRWRPFKFYDSSLTFPNASEIYGFWVPLEMGGDAEPTSGSPSVDANVVTMVE